MKTSKNVCYDNISKDFFVYNSIVSFKAFYYSLGKNRIASPKATLFKNTLPDFYNPKLI